jgi:hypothetical protein
MLFWATVLADDSQVQKWGLDVLSEITNVTSFVCDALMSDISSSS